MKCINFNTKEDFVKIQAMNQAAKMFQMSGVLSEGKMSGRISDDQATYRDSLLMSFVNTLFLLM